MRLKLFNDLCTINETIAASAVVGKNQRKQKGNTEKCPKNGFLFHKLAKCDLNPSANDPSGRDNRKAIKLARAENEEGGCKQDQD